MSPAYTKVMWVALTPEADQFSSSYTFKDIEQIHWIERDEDWYGTYEFYTKADVKPLTEKA